MLRRPKAVSNDESALTDVRDSSSRLVSTPHRDSKWAPRTALHPQKTVTIRSQRGAEITPRESLIATLARPLSAPRDDLRGRRISLVRGVEIR